MCMGVRVYVCKLMRNSSWENLCPPPSGTSLLCSLFLYPFHFSTCAPFLPAFLSSPLCHLLQPTLYRSSSLYLFSVSALPWSQLKPGNELPMVPTLTQTPAFHSDFSRDNDIVTQFHSQMSTFVPMDDLCFTGWGQFWDRCNLYSVERCLFSGVHLCASSVNEFSEKDPSWLDRTRFIR